MSTLLKALRRADQPQFTSHIPAMGLPVTQEEEQNRRWIWWLLAPLALLMGAGANYGWPIVTHGIDYSGAKISDHKSLPGLQDPVRVWVPSISPSGLCFYTGQRFPGWRGSVFTGALSNEALFRIELDGERYRSEERLLVDRLPYIRDVRQGPDGLLYVVTHANDGGLFRVEPA